MAENECRKKGNFSFAGNEYSCLVVESNEEAAEEGMDFERRFPGAGEFMSRDVHAETENPLNSREEVSDDGEEEFFEDVEGDGEEEFFDEADSEEEEFFDDEYEEEFFDDDDEEEDWFERRYIKKRYRGKHEKKRKGIFAGAKDFVKNNVVPLFMEGSEDEADLADEETTEVMGEPVEDIEDVDVTSEDIDEERRTVKEMLSSAGVAIVGAGKKGWKAMQDKVINPIVEKIGNDDEYDDYDETDTEESEAAKPTTRLRLVNPIRKKKDEAEEDDDEFVEVEENSKPSLKQRIEEFFARDMEDEYFEDETLSDEDEKPGFFEALGILLAGDDEDDYEDDYEEVPAKELEPKKVKKPAKEKAPKKKFNLLEKAKGLLYDSDYEEVSQDAETIAIDQDVFDEIMNEKQAEMERLNNGPEIVFISADEFPDAETEDEN